MRLTTLQGPRNSAPSVLDPRGLSPLEAGLLFFSLVTHYAPGITYRDIFSGRRGLSGDWGFLSDAWDAVKTVTGDIKDGIGDVFSDTASLIGSQGGDLIRLATDEEVLDSVMRAGSAYASGGASEALRALTPEQRQVIEAAGTSYQMQWPGAAGDWARSPVTWIIAGVAGLSFVAWIVKGKS